MIANERSNRPERKAKLMISRGDPEKEKEQLEKEAAKREKERRKMREKQRFTPVFLTRGSSKFVEGLDEYDEDPNDPNRFELSRKRRREEEVSEERLVRAKQADRSVVAVERAPKRQRLDRRLVPVHERVLLHVILDHVEHLVGSDHQLPRSIGPVHDARVALHLYR